MLKKIKNNKIVALVMGTIIITTLTLILIPTLSKYVFNPAAEVDYNTANFYFDSDPKSLSTKKEEGANDFIIETFYLKNYEGENWTNHDIIYSMKLNTDDYKFVDGEGLLNEITGTISKASRIDQKIENIKIRRVAAAPPDFENLNLIISSTSPYTKTLTHILTLNYKVYVTFSPWQDTLMNFDIVNLNVFSEDLYTTNGSYKDGEAKVVLEWGSNFDIQNQDLVAQRYSADVSLTDPADSDFNNSGSIVNLDTGLRKLVILVPSTTQTTIPFYKKGSNTATTTTTDPPPPNSITAKSYMKTDDSAWMNIPHSSIEYTWPTT